MVIKLIGGLYWYSDGGGFNVGYLDYMVKLELRKVVWKFYRKVEWAGGL